ncbi:MAG TPA: N-methyl-L-tryptophan oxidase [Candidatus Dormibacteraeota bacterium]
MTERRADVAVVGAGAMGTMALWRLALMGVSCVGFEQFRPGHGLGSSTGDTRIFRTAYFEGPGYVPLLQAALPLWRELEEASGEPLLNLCGALMIGGPDSVIVRGALRSARQHGLQHELIDGEELARRHPQHRLAGGEVAVVDPAAGFLRPEKAVAAAARVAAQAGAELKLETRVEAIESSGEGFRLTTSDGAWLANRMILASGAWNPRWVPDLPLQVERVVQTWFPIDDAAAFSAERFPVFIRQLDDGFTRYGIPSTGEATIKVAGHGGGRAADPDTVDRDATADDWASTADFVRRWLCGVGGEPVQARVCMYTNSPDEHFVIGEPPGRPGVVLVSACSGHGFKFAPVIGEIAARLANGADAGFDLVPFSPRRLVAVT